MHRPLITQLHNALLHITRQPSGSTHHDRGLTECLFERVADDILGLWTATEDLDRGVHEERLFSWQLGGGGTGAGGAAGAVRGRAAAAWCWL